MFNVRQQLHKEPFCCIPLEKQPNFTCQFLYLCSSIPHNERLIGDVQTKSQLLISRLCSTSSRTFLVIVAVQARYGTPCGMSARTS